MFVRNRHPSNCGEHPGSRLKRSAEPIGVRQLSTPENRPHEPEFSFPNKRKLLSGLPNRLQEQCRSFFHRQLRDRGEKIPGLPFLLFQNRERREVAPQSGHRIRPGIRLPEAPNGLFRQWSRKPKVPG